MLECLGEGFPRGGSVLMGTWVCGVLAVYVASCCGVGVAGAQFSLAPFPCGWTGKGEAKGKIDGWDFQFLSLGTHRV